MRGIYLDYVTIVIQMFCDVTILFSFTFNNSNM